MKCPVCSAEMEKVFNLPALPFTDKPGSADQGFLFCSCGHGMLERVYPQESGPMGESHYLNVFTDFIKKHSRHDFVLDIGGADGGLSKFLPGNHQVIDPAVNCGIEEASLDSYRFTHKLIVASHTLEHIADPKVFMDKVSRCMRDGDTLAIQVPSLEALLSDYRFDQVYHQHIHYFSERSLSALLASYGLEIIAREANPNHWGALMVIAKRGSPYVMGPKVDLLDVVFSKFFFDIVMGAWRHRLRNGGFVLYGASPMLSVMSYYLPLDKAELVADDDENKEGIWRNKRVTTSYDFKDKDVVITASSKVAARKLTIKALTLGARNVYTPFQ